MTSLAAILSGVILAILGGRAAWVLHAERGDRGRPRGVEPGPGHVEIESHYASGMGGEHMVVRVPRDPQEYARSFVPKRSGKHRS